MRSSGRKLLQNAMPVFLVTEDELVSSDIIRDPRASIVQLDMTRVVGGNLVKIMSWYDNEWGYTHQMIRTALAALGLRESA